MELKTPTTTGTTFAFDLHSLPVSRALSWYLLHFCTNIIASGGCNVHNGWFCSLVICNYTDVRSLLMDFLISLDIKIPQLIVIFLNIPCNMLVPFITTIQTEFSTYLYILDISMMRPTASCLFLHSTWASLVQPHKMCCTVSYLLPHI